MKQKITGFFICLLALLVLDILWFILSLETFYKPLMGDLLNPAPNLYAAGVFYVIYAAAICYFAVFKSNTIKETAVNAAFLGLCAFATYDLTAMAVINGFGLKLAIGDMAWGVTAATSSSIITKLSLNQFFKTK